MANSSNLTAALKIKRLRTIYILYWFLLAYIVAALVWWFIALNQQNTMMTNLKLHELNSNDPGYQEKLNTVTEGRRRKTAQYIGEGATFLLLIAAGTLVVFRAVRRQFRQSQQQQDFMMAITHELKTPIAVTKLNLETLQKHRLPEEQQQKLIANTLQEADRLNSLCNNLLLAGQMETNAYEPVSERIDLSELLDQCVLDHRLRFPGRIIATAIQDEIYFNGDRLMLQMAINNLLDNAIKYSGKEGKIEAGIKREVGYTQIFVKDEGKGIADDEKNKIFNKFYRTGNVYTRGAKGTGLGLYLTKKIVEEHAGKILVSDNTPQGSIFEIQLKNNNDE